MAQRASSDHSYSDSHSDKSDCHDYVDKDGSYKRRCYCQKCVKKWCEWNDRKKKEGHVKGYRRCYTVCEYKFKKPIHIVDTWGYKKKFEGKWEHYDKKEHSHRRDSDRSGSEKRDHKRRD